MVYRKIRPGFRLNEAGQDFEFKRLILFIISVIRVAIPYPCPQKGNPFKALTKQQAVERIAESNGYPESQSSEILETLLEIIKSTLESGEDVLVSGFGKFCVNGKKARKGRNRQLERI